MSTTVVLDARPDVSALFGRLNHVLPALDAIEAALPALDAEEALDLWLAVDEAGARAWQVRAAISYHLTQRIHAAVGRGHRDEHQQGVNAAVTALAARLNVDPSTIWRDRHIYETTHNYWHESSNLRDRGFYLLAARCPDPGAALEQMSAEKDVDSFYTVKRARAQFLPVVEPALPSPSASSSSPDVLALITALEGVSLPHGDDYRDGWLDALMALRRRLGSSS